MRSVLVLSAPSGCGKTTLAKALVARSDRFVFSVSATTRKPRPDERDGVDYHFRDKASFLRMVENGELLEWVEVHGNLYGTPRAGVLDPSRPGLCTVLDIDVQGALLLKATTVDPLLVFILPPSLESVQKRLALRGSEQDDERKRRLRAALDELERVRRFDVVVVNDALEECVDELMSVAEGRGTGIGAEEAARRVSALRREIEAMKKWDPE